MKAGKDYMADKPGIITFEQLKEVKKVQKETKRIYSIMYSERLGDPAAVKAGSWYRRCYWQGGPDYWPGSSQDDTQITARLVF